VPVANRRKSRNWPVWRAAAAIVVVALGSFVVLRERDGSSDQRISDHSSMRTTSRQTTTGEPLSVGAPPVGEKPQLREQRAVVPPLPPPRAARAAAPRGAAAGSGDNSTTSLAQRSAAADVRESAPLSVAEPATIVVLPRDVGRRAQIGASTTLYEVAPGDTVVLTEATETRLGATVVTGLGVTTSAPAASGARAMTKSAAPDTTRAETNTRSKALANTQSSAQLAMPVAAPAAPVNAPAAAVVAAPANDYHTITWLDSTTGKKVSLSGRHSVQELEEIRRKIEALRASRAAEKKHP
jgi:hypothetical protein